jgi:hypothetical protein
MQNNNSVSQILAGTKALTMEETLSTHQPPLDIKDLTRDELVSSLYWQLDPETFPLSVSRLVRTRADALEVFRLIVSLVQHECPGVEEWLSVFNGAYKTLQCWGDIKLAQEVTGDDTAALDLVRDFIKNLCNKHPDSNQLYSAYNLMEGLEVAWAQHSHTLQEV